MDVFKVKMFHVTGNAGNIRNKISLFRESLRLVYVSSPGWASANIGISVIRSFLPLVLVWLFKILIDDITRSAATGSGIQSGNVISMIIAVVALYFLDEATSDFSNYIRKKQSLELEVYMFGLLHAKSVKLDLINFEQPEYFDCLSRASREAPWRPNSILNNLVSFLRGLISLLLMAGLILKLNWMIAVLLLVANIPAIWLRLYFAEVLYNFQREQTPEARKSAYFNWLLTGDRPSREIRLFGLGNYFIGLFKNSFIKQKKDEIAIVRKRTIIELVSNLFKASALMIALWYIANSTINGKLTLGQMAMFLLAFRQGMIYIKDLFSSLAGLYEDGLFIEDTFEFLNLTENIKAADPVVIAAPLKNGITVDGLTFIYRGNNSKTIDNVSFQINKGEVIAIVGSNGAGKSTLVRLLCRLYDPDSGSVKYDGNNIKNMDPDEYRKHFSVVFQDFMLYNMKAGDNISMGNINEKNSVEKIRSAARNAGVDEILSGLPEGYDTTIGNLFSNSRELSWGEWQKIAIARALFREASVLILDEPSSALDADTEYEIFSRFREIVKDRTAILISHRFTNVNLADRILVLDKGSLIEMGTHDELLKKDGVYCKMFMKQSSRFNR
jgi:ATP-binding cassette subfamily B protein